jgi:hypothetical protein
MWGGAGGEDGIGEFFGVGDGGAFFLTILHQILEEAVVVIVRPM